MKIAVKFAKAWPLTFLVIGGLLLAMGVYLQSLTGEFQASLVSALVMVVLGVLGTFNPFYTFQGSELHAKNLLGMTVFKHPVDNLEVDDGPKPGEKRLYVVRKNGSRKRLMSTHSGFFDRKQVAAMVSAVQAAKSF